MLASCGIQCVDSRRTQSSGLFDRSRQDSPTGIRASANNQVQRSLPSLKREVDAGFPYRSTELWEFQRGRCGSIVEMRRSTLLLVGALIIGGCSDSLKPALEARSAQLRVEADLAGAQVSTLVIEVTAADILTPLVFNLAIQNGVASGTISVPAGSGRTITMHAYDVNGIETHRGSATEDIQPGTNPTLSMHLNPITGEQPIAVQVGSVTVSVTPSTVTVQTGQTAQLTATLTDATGTVVAGDVQWATLNPGIAVVDSKGLVTARANGVVKIAATYSGVGAASVVTVLAP